MKLDNIFCVTGILCTLYNPIVEFSRKKRLECYYCASIYYNSREKALIRANSTTQIKEIKMESLIKHIEELEQLGGKNKDKTEDSEQFVIVISCLIFRDITQNLETYSISNTSCGNVKFKVVDDYCCAINPVSKLVFTPFYDDARKLIKPLHIPRKTIEKNKIAKKFIRFVFEISKNLREYKSDDTMTSRISEFLATGLIHPRVIATIALWVRKSEGREEFLRELLWRDYFFLVVSRIPRKKLLSPYGVYNRKKIIWKHNTDFINQWKTADTGEPYVDFYMKELNKTGFMPNRARMIVANYFCVHKRQDWRIGAAYFAEKLLDHDFSSNIMGWEEMSNLWLGRPYKFKIPDLGPTKQ